MTPTSAQRLRLAVRFLVCGTLATAVVLVGLFAAGVVVVRHVASRITVDPQALRVVIYEAVATTLRTGTSAQKLEILAAFAPSSPADLVPYAPLFRDAATTDPNPEVREAAGRLLGKIPPVGPTLPPAGRTAP